MLDTTAIKWVNYQCYIWIVPRHMCEGVTMLLGNELLDGLPHDMRSLAQWIN